VCAATILLFLFVLPFRLGTRLGEQAVNSPGNFVVYTDQKDISGVQLIGSLERGVLLWNKEEKVVTLLPWNNVRSVERKEPKPPP
jgi:hypothetical protein